MSEIEDHEVFSDVMDKFRIIADNEYDGKIYENVLSIYAQLTHAERKLFLKSLIQVYFIFSRSISEASLPDEDKKKDKTAKEVCTVIQSEIDDISSANERELIKLKTWLVKWFVAAGTITFIIFSAFMAYTGQTGEVNVWKDRIMAVWNVVKVLFNI